MRKTNYKRLKYQAPLSNFDIIALMADYPAFGGVIMRDKIHRAAKDKSYVINLDDSTGRGTHWVALFRKPREDYYFDSFGLPPPEEILEGRRGRRLFYSNNQIQGKDSIMCGYYAVVFLQQMMDGKSFYDFVMQWDRRPENNENLLLSLAARL